MPHARRRLRRLSLAGMLLMLAVVLSSAWLRLAQERPVCSSWPGCRGALSADTGAAAAPWMGSPGVMASVRLTHRVAASAMLPLTIALALLALTRRPRDTATGQRALAMLGLALALAVLGVVTPGSRSPWVLLGNHLGGLLLLALAWNCWRRLAGGSPATLAATTSATTSAATSATTPAISRWARPLALLWLLQAALGSGSGGGVGGGAALVHLALAAPAVLGAFMLGILGQRQRCPGALPLTLVAVTQVPLGVAAMLGAAPPPLVLLHNGVAALGLALLYDLAMRGRDPAPPGPASPVSAHR
ncbi:MAG TPA: COX15/CtaA family protein [Rubrivivax sp.]|nr:COX15/CtaA family protein [Rubrivivax sp.]